MRYPTLLFDLDHTLLDSDESERLAYAHTMAQVGLDDPASHFDRYVQINREMWRAVETGELRPTDVRHRRFERFNAEVGLDADAHAMADLFVDGLCAFGELFPGARAVLERLAERAVLAMVTNGLSRVQRTRIERLDLGDLFDSVIISQEVGVTKPRSEIFDRVFAELGEPDRSGALMIGDSLTSDIAGGRNAGIDTCWYNPHGVDRRTDDPITHEITALIHLEAIVGEPAGAAEGGSGARPTGT